MTDQLKREARQLAPALLDIFRSLHRRPELGNRERHTAELIRRRLEELGIAYVPLLDTGTVAVIRDGPSPSGRISTRCPSRRRRRCPTPPSVPA